MAAIHGLDPNPATDDPDAMVETIRETVEQNLRMIDQRVQSLMKQADCLRRVLATLEEPAGPLAAVPAASRQARGAIHTGAGREGRAEWSGARRPRALASSRRRAKAPQGANKERLFAVLRSRPGLTPSELAEVTGIKRETVSSTVSRMLKRGELRPQPTPEKPNAVALPEQPIAGGLPSPPAPAG